MVELEFADTAADAILPLTLVKVAVRPSIDPHSIRLVIEIVPEVHALVRIDVSSEAILFVILPEAFVF